jgi:hypothetical protein
MKKNNVKVLLVIIICSIAYSGFSQSVSVFETLTNKYPKDYAQIKQYADSAEIIMKRNMSSYKENERYTYRKTPNTSLSKQDSFVVIRLDTLQVEISLWKGEGTYGFNVTLYANSVYRVWHCSYNGRKNRRDYSFDTHTYADKQNNTIMALGDSYIQVYPGSVQEQFNSGCCSDTPYASGILITTNKECNERYRITKTVDANYFLKRLKELSIL